MANATADTRYKFTGRESDGETGLYYYRARYFDARVGRFIGQDSMGFGAGDSNLYRYVGNSPLNGTDPSGNFKVELRYRNAFPGVHHTDVVVSDKNGIRSYWAKAGKNGKSTSVFGNIIADKETQAGKYKPGFIFYVDDPKRI